LKRIDYIKERIPYLEKEIKRLSKVISNLYYEIRATSHDIPPDSGRWLVGGRPARPSGIPELPSNGELNEFIRKEHQEAKRKRKNAQDELNSVTNELNSLKYELVSILTDKSHKIRKEPRIIIIDVKDINQ